MVEKSRLTRLFKNLKKKRVTVIGDFALDVYWHSDMTRSELSRETPFHTRPVITENCYPGAAGNVAANLASLGCGSVHCVTAVGKDWRGEMLITRLCKKKICTDGIISSSERSTEAYIKPMLKGFERCVEGPRFDFVNQSRVSRDIEQELIERVKDELSNSDAVVLCDQFKQGIFTGTFIETCIELSTDNPDIPFFCDSRERPEKFSDMVIKPNKIEACRAAGVDCRGREPIQRAGRELCSHNREVFVTSGDQGVYYFGPDGEEFHQKGFPAGAPVDTVGAGDTFLSALAGLTAAGADRHEAAFAACLASSITVSKTGMTGTPATEDIMDKLDKFGP